jgi:transcriptional regulator with XRE-family HTH domain
LADKAGVSLETVKRIEKSAGPISALAATLDKLQRALEAAGVEFTNGGRPGVRMRGRKTERFFMTEQAFQEGLQLFKQEILPQRAGLQIENISATSIWLTLEGTKIATASQDRGEAVFDPAPSWTGHVRSGEDAKQIFGDWAGLAYRQASG